MQKYIAEGEIVEGKKCRIMTRRYEFKRLSKDPITNEIMVTCNLDRNSEVEVLESLSLDCDEKTLRETLNVHGEVGDMLEARSILVFVEGLRPNVLSFEVKEGQTGRHGANLASTNRRTIGKIKYVLENLRKAIEQSSSNNYLTAEK